MSIDAANTKIAGGGTDVKNLEQFVNLSRLDALEASSEPVIAAAEFLLLYAYEQRASDIHIEPRRMESIIRMRIDGVLHAVYRIPKAVHNAITNRFKVMARLDISARKPQDGRLRTARGEGEMDLRVSTIPTAFGDKVVIRVLDPSVLVRDLAEFGFLGGEREELERWLHRPHGLVVVTGPTGSGKTTTLYSALQALASPEVNVVTIEDPIEMVHESFNQIQADAHTGTSFAEALRHVLRQDPDVIMVGEVRDGETAVQAVQAALTGHLVLTTLHTNDTVGAISGWEIWACPPSSPRRRSPGRCPQRLVRNVCRPAPPTWCSPRTRSPRSTSPTPRSTPAGSWPAAAPAAPSAATPATTGARASSRSWGSTPALRKLISEGASPEVLSRTARQDGLRTLREHAVAKVAAGVTTLEEALRVTADAGA